jgi:teichuronic acid biosynthesis glycosyltransferase TuaG
MRATLHYSVVIPVYNRREKLLRAIRSVSNLIRSPGDRLEVVVVDDASTDGSGDVARNAGVDRVLILQENSGVTEAKNRGIAASAGEILIFLDSDDELMRYALVKIREHFEQNPHIDILFGACVDRDGQIMHSRDAKLGVLTYKHLLATSAPGEFLPVVKRKVFEKILFESKLKGFEGITWLKAARTGFILHYSGEVLRIYDKEGEDRLCRQENIFRGADRMAHGWHSFLCEFGRDLWLVNKIAYFQTVMKWVVYSRIATGASGKLPTSLRGGWGLKKVFIMAFQVFCSIIPRIFWARYLNSR